MLTTAILKNCIDDLNSITKVSICVFDYSGLKILYAGDDIEIDKEIVSDFSSSPADSQIMGDVHLMKVYDEEELIYILATKGSDDNAYTVAKIAVSQLDMLLVAYKEKYDRNTFFQNLLMDNLLLVDVYNRAKKLHIDVDVPRVIFIIEVDDEKDTIAHQLLKSMFTIENGDYITKIDEKNIILIKSVDDNSDSESIHQIAQSIVDTISAEAMVNVRVGYGTLVKELKNVSKSYKEAMMAVDVGKIFNAERKVNAYGSLGIGRLIYQLPVNLCQMFIEEIFKDNDPSSFDEEVISTIYKFFENNLNVSETARQLFIHRNTLVYRIEKLKNLTGLDVRIFDDALTFMIAMMVYNYIKYLEE